MLIGSVPMVRPDLHLSKKKSKINKVFQTFGKPCSLHILQTVIKLFEWMHDNFHLTNELREIDKVLGLPSILLLFRNRFRQVHVVYIQFQKRIEKTSTFSCYKIKATVRTMWHMAGPLKDFNSSWFGAHWKHSDGVPKFTSKQEKIKDKQYFLNVW